MISLLIPHPVHLFILALGFVVKMDRLISKVMDAPERTHADHH